MAKMACTGAQVVKSLGSNLFSRNLSILLCNSQCSRFAKCRPFSSQPLETETERDPAPLFFNHEVQQLLKTLTRVDLKKVFRSRKDGQRLTPPAYKFMTEEDLEKAMAEAEDKADRRLQMPPVVKIRKEINSVLSKDPALQGFETSKLVVTDISYGVKNCDRLIVVREPDGTLRQAIWDERQRLNQIYFPLYGRRIRTPKMFEKEYLMDLLKREEYEFVLNRACLQYEPDDPEYHRVTETVYSCVSKEKHFEHLRSTRHYGSMAFHLAWNKAIDNLLLENLHTERMEDAALLIQLYNKIHPTAKSAQVEYDGDNMKLLEKYIELESPQRRKLELALESYKELEKERQAVAEGIQRAHGIQ